VLKKAGRRIGYGAHDERAGGQGNTSNGKLNNKVLNRAGTERQLPSEKERGDKRMKWANRRKQGRRKTWRAGGRARGGAHPTTRRIRTRVERSEEARR